MEDNVNKKDKISNNIQNFVSENKDLLKTVKKFRKHNMKKNHIIKESHKKLYKYLSDVKIMIITANEIEKTSLFSYAFYNNRTPFIQIGKGDIVYTFFTLGALILVHVEINAGSNSHGGASDIIKKVIKEIAPSIIIILGVAFGCDYNKTKLGDVLVGRQHFSYDKSTKVSNGNIGIKKLHLEEPDEYMINRFKTLVPTEEKIRGDFRNKFQVVLGNMITGEFVVDSIEFREMIFEPFKAFGVVGGEMEAYGIFEEIKSHDDIHCILIKGICDWGAGKNDEIKKDNEKCSNPKNNIQTLAALNACNVCGRLLDNDKIFSDCRIKGIRKLFYRVGIGRIFKSDIVDLKRYIVNMN